MAVVLKGWRYGLFIGGIVGFIGAALYPIIIYPMMNPEEYRKMQEAARAGLDREKIQPGNMKIWSDPFDRRVEK